LRDEFHDRSSDSRIAYLGKGFSEPNRICICKQLLGAADVTDVTPFDPLEQRRYRNVESRGDLRQPARSNAVHTFFIFLDLLKCYTHLPR
jgi:hypothetical protein